MAGEEERMENTEIWKVKGKRRWKLIRVVAQDTRASPNSLETDLVRKRGK